MTPASQRAARARACREHVGATREAHFQAFMATRGVTLERASRFRFHRSSYRPDFYAPAQGIYYEVVGSRQRAATLRFLLDLMDRYYPGIRLRLVSPNGQPYRAEHNHHLQLRWSVPFGAELATALDRRGWTLRDLQHHLSIKNLSAALTSGTGRPTLAKVHAWLQEEDALRPRRKGHA